MVFIISNFVYLVVSTVMLLLSVLDIMMMARMIMSWLFPMSDGRIAQFLYSVTEVVVYPVRALADHFGWFEGFPFDIPFMITYFLLIVLQMILPTVAL